jgi:hypothetical protein
MTWRAVARYVVGAFRAGPARARAGVEIRRLFEELSGGSPEFKSMWADNENTQPAKASRVFTIRYADEPI